jgi:type IV pilus assembly protein PilW
MSMARGHMTGSLPSGASARGFTMVELMVAMTISLLLALALTTLVVHNSRATTELDRSSRQVENGRYALDMLGGEISLAGYYAEVIAPGATYSTPAPCATSLTSLGFSTSPVQLPAPLQGQEGTSLDPAPTCAGNHRANTATLTLRRLSTRTTATTAVVHGNAYVQTSRCKTDPGTAPFILDQTSSAFTLRDITCTTVLPVRQYLSRIYYVADCSTCGSDSIPTLKRVDLIDGNAVITPLAEGIEEIQFEYGFDTDGDGVPDRYLASLDGVAGSPANDWSNVMSVRIWLISRTTEVTQGYTDTKTYELGTFGARGPFNDGYKRRVYSMVVRLNNPAGWRE